MILVDTSVLSTFARADALGLLSQLFPGRVLGLTPAILREVAEAIEQGCTWLREVPALVKSERLRLMAPAPV